MDSLSVVYPSVHSFSYLWSPQAVSSHRWRDGKGCVGIRVPPSPHHPPASSPPSQGDRSCRTPLSSAQGLGVSPLLPCRGWSPGRPLGGPLLGSHVPLPGAGLTWGSGTWLRRSCRPWCGCVAFLNAARPCWGAASSVLMPGGAVLSLGMPSATPASPDLTPEVTKVPAPSTPFQEQCCGIEHCVLGTACVRVCVHVCVHLCPQRGLGPGLSTSGSQLSPSGHPWSWSQLTP